MTEPPASPATARLAAVLGCCAAALLAGTAVANASAVAILDATGIAVIDSAGGARTPLAGPGDWWQIAYGGDGRLFATRSGDEMNGCELVDVASGETIARPDDVLASTERGQGLCEIATDPAAGLLFGADNSTAGSLTTFRLDPSSLAVSPAMYGYGASAATDGTLVTIQHRYWRAGGSYEQPWLMAPSGAIHPLSKTPAPLSTNAPTFTAISITRDAKRVAGTTSAGALYTGAASDRLRKRVWKLASKHTFDGVQWLSDGSGLLAGVVQSPSAKTLALYRTDAAGRHRSRLATGLQGFAVAPVG